MESDGIEEMREQSLSLVYQKQGFAVFQVNVHIASGSRGPGLGLSRINFQICKDSVSQPLDMALCFGTRH